MKTRFILFFITIVMMSCTSNVKKNKVELTTSKADNDLKIVDSDSIARKIVFDFYNWYTNDVYLKKTDTYRIAPYKKYDENKYGLDIESYRISIDSIRFFSTSFKNFLIQRSIKCNQDMLKETWDSNPKYEGNFNISSCACLWNIEWFGNQEGDSRRFTILKASEKNEDGYTYFVQNYIGDTPAFIFKVKTVLEGNEYKIASINRQ